MVGNNLFLCSMYAEWWDVGTLEKLPHIERQTTIIKSPSQSATALLNWAKNRT